MSLVFFTAGKIHACVSKSQTTHFKSRESVPRVGSLGSVSPRFCLLFSTSVEFSFKRHVFRQLAYASFDNVAGYPSERLRVQSARVYNKYWSQSRAVQWSASRLIGRGGSRSGKCRFDSHRMSLVDSLRRSTSNSLFSISSSLLGILASRRMAANWRRRSPCTACAIQKS